MARRVLSEGPAAFEGARLRQRAPDLDRGQRHVLPHAISGDLPEWASEVPDGFVFSIKGSRYVTNRRVLSEAGESIERFLNSGVTELGDKLGPLLWQFAPFKKFDEADFGAFLELLPETFNGRKLRHVVEVRHDSFKTPEFIALLRKFNIAAVYTDHETYPNIADITGDFVYARLQQGEDTIPTAYPPKELDAWAKRLRTWARQGAGRPAARRSEAQAEGRAARRVCLCDPRGQGAGAGGGDGADRGVKE